jgi:3-hydroxyisobutyrate dehydrogenase-like beta-hydroxyacid dehydrogenase
MSAMIGFIGLGIMGQASKNPLLHRPQGTSYLLTPCFRLLQGMAENLVTKANRKLVVWNRSPNKGKEFCAKHGDCRSVATPAEVVESCEIIYLMLSDLHASNCVYKGENGILSADLKGKKLIDCATLTAEHMVKDQPQHTSRPEKPPIIADSAFYSTWGSFLSSDGAGKLSNCKRRHLP